MENRSGIRELQIARGLITLRWASIPIIFGFSLLSLKLLGMSFRIEPIYVLCCLLAILNVFFTLHFSLLSRQMMVAHGMNSLKKLLLKVISNAFAGIRSRGLIGILAIPAAVPRIFAVLYLMLLEAFKDVSFNIFSINNVMHTQVIGDLMVIMLLTRYTGTTESPMMFLSVVPITVAGAVMGFRTGAVYTMMTIAAWTLTSTLVKYQIIPHIKFYPPLYGDLSQNSGWIISNALVVSAGLGSASYLAHKLTLVFKERIFFLNDLLYKSNTRAVSSSMAAEQTSCAWLIADASGKVEKVKVDKSGIFTADLVDKNLMQAFPELEQYGMAYVIQAVITSGSRRALEKIKIRSREGTEHIFNARLSSFKDCENQTRIIAMFEDRTEELFIKTHLESLKKELAELQTSFEKISLENRDNHRMFEDMQKLANDRAVEIELLSHKIKALKAEESNANNQIASLMNELAAIKATNDQLTSDLEYKQMILDEISELVNVCTELDALTTLVEKKAQELFKLDNTCLHIFKAEDSQNRRNEILDIRTASPRLLDIPRNNPEALNPVLNEGRPVMINAQITPEKSASMEITNGSMHRLIAYVPVRHQGKVLGMMMLEKFGQEESSETTINMVSYYLKHASAAIRNAVAFRESQNKNDRMHKSITRLYTQLDSIKAMVFSRPDEEEQPFFKFLCEFAKITLARDVLMARISNDGSCDPCSRVDRSRQFKLSQYELELARTIQKNPMHKAILELEEEETTCAAYPLMHENRLFGIVMVYHTSEHPAEETITEFCVRLLRDRLALYTLNEEKEIWETFYHDNLSA
ncbi:MAG: hypothetical protein CVV42_11095 [Candidatus Riflebacteria bacterium HGW-Riflebacteria-2]|jgi:GAF domain-containing protein|nr:MAG: hypothetical protein CVV42_11095 [Candidatus Riflebacteria bacterium HGW-Riflebacteria-2]